MSTKPRIVYLEGGVLPPEVEQVLLAEREETTSHYWERHVDYDLMRLGYITIAQVPVEYREDGHRGRIDLFAHKGDVRIFIELDNVTASKKSLAKLAKVDGIRVIACRKHPAPKSDHWRYLPGNEKYRPSPDGSVPSP